MWWQQRNNGVSDGHRFSPFNLAGGDSRVPAAYAGDPRGKNPAFLRRAAAATRARWSDANDVPFAGFNKRHLDRYLIERAKTVSPTTLRHDAVSAKSFFRWRQKNDLPRIRRCASTRPSSACSTATATARSFWDSPTAPAGSARCSMGVLGAAGPGEARRRYRHTQRHAAAKRG